MHCSQYIASQFDAGCRSTLRVVQTGNHPAQQANQGIPPSE